MTIVTPFDHLFILYTGMIIGIICFVFPFLIAIYKYFETKRLSIDEQADEECDNLSNNLRQILADEQLRDGQNEEILKTGKAIKKENRKKKRLKIYFSPQVRFWIILFLLLTSLIMCIIDIITGEKGNLISWSFTPFGLAILLLIDTLVWTVKFLKETIGNE